MTVTVTKSEGGTWTVPKLPPDLDPELVAQAQAVRRLGLAAGEGGFWASRVTMPPGQVTVPHHHDHSELILVLEGSMDFDDGEATTELAERDAAVIEAGHTYGFTVGDDGVEFLLVRAAASQSHVEPQGEDRAG